ncbi:MAG: VanZ family protein [Planctomycetales bacterium]|nr:VanZ family protein [Planctomycetales bacterium]
MRPVTGIKILGFRLGVISLAVYWITLFLGTHWPAGVEIAPDISDKVKHFGGYFGLATLCCYVTSSPGNDRRATARRFLGVIAFLTVYGCIDELTQAFSPGRTPDVLDVLADIAGTVSAVGVYLVGKHYFAQRAYARLERNQS